MSRSKPSLSPGYQAFLAAILDEPDHAGAAAFAASILGEETGYPNEPRDEKRRWTTGDPHEDWINAVMRGGPVSPETSGDIDAARNLFMNAAMRHARAGSAGPFDDSVVKPGFPSGAINLPYQEKPGSPPPYDYLPYQEKPGDFNSRIELCMAPPDAPPDPSPGLGNTVIAAPDGKDATKPTTTEWFDKYIWGPLQQNGGTSVSKEKLEDVFFTGCIGLATLITAGQFRPVNPSTHQVMDQSIPDVRTGFLTLDEALKYRDQQNRDNPIKQEGTTLSGNAPSWRIFALLYSSKNETFPTAEPSKGPDGSYNLSGNDVLLTIADRSGPKDVSNFDFFSRSEPGDPWYNADRPWLHADQGGKDKMNLEATDTKGIEKELAHNNSNFDRRFYFVATERQYPKPR